jgi:hypothetical protein
MKRTMAAACVLLLSASLASAGPLKLEQVAGNAVWVAHLDVTSLLKSGIGKFILEEAEKKEGFLEGIAQIRETLGFDPLSDVGGLTLYGKKFGDKSGVVVLDATADQDKIVALLEANATHKTSAYGDHTLHEWTDPAKTKTDPATGEQVVVKEAETKFGTFYDEKTILVASSMDLLKGAVDVLAGKAENLAKTAAIQTLPKPVEGVILTVGAEKIDLAAQDPTGKPNPFRTITDLSVQVGEVQGAMFLHAKALVATAEKALKLRQVVQGFVALGQMMMAEQPDLPVLGEKVQVGGTDNAVQVDAEIPTESLIKMIRFLAERKKRTVQAPS